MNISELTDYINNKLNNTHITKEKIQECQLTLDTYYNELDMLQFVINDAKDKLKKKPQNIKELVKMISNPYQIRSLEKLLLSWDEEKLYFINYIKNEEQNNLEGTFTMMGSLKKRSNGQVKREKYEVKMYKCNTNEKTFFCNCPDHKFNSTKHNMVCKHICFLVCKIGKILDSEFFNSKQLTPEQHDILLQRVINTQELLLEGSIYNPPRNATKEIFMNKSKHIEEHDMCPICFDNISDREILSCPNCKNYVHNECMKVWLETKNTCVFCRSDVWKIYKLN
jgi:hypothetical protein